MIENLQDPSLKETKYIRRATFLIILIAVTAAFLGLIGGFLLATFWAMVLAIIFRGTYKWVLKKLKGRKNLASGITTIFIFFAVLIPISGISFALFMQSKDFVKNIETDDISMEAFIFNVQDKIPYSDRILETIDMSTAELKTKINELVINGSKWAGDQAISYTTGAFSFAIQFSLMLYLLYFFIRDASKIKRVFIDTFPLHEHTEQILIDRFVSVSRATLKGTVIVAIVQGAIGGLLFAVLGIPGAAFWGLLMAVFSLLPVGGSAIIWVPTSIYLVIQGDVTEAIIIVIVGSLIIGLVDNLLRPILIGRDTQMPDYIVLLATLGGIAWFGLSGFIIGPVIAALFITCWELLNERFVREENDPPSIIEG